MFEMTFEWVLKSVMMKITPEQRDAIEQAGNSPIEVSDPESGNTYVMLRFEVYQRLLLADEELEDRHVLEGWSQLARKSRDQWAEAELR